MKWNREGRTEREGAGNCANSAAGRGRCQAISSLFYSRYANVCAWLHGVIFALGRHAERRRSHAQRGKREVEASLSQPKSGGQVGMLRLRLPAQPSLSMTESRTW